MKEKYVQSNLDLLLRNELKFLDHKTKHVNLENIFRKYM